MNLPPTRLLLTTWLTITATTPCVLELTIPIALPHRLDPSLPSLPYHLSATPGPEDLHHLAEPTLRRLMAAVVQVLLGPEQAAAVLIARERGTPGTGFPLRFFHRVEATVCRASEVEFGKGWYKDRRGVEYRHPIEATEYDEVDDEIAVLESFTVYLVRGVRDGREMVEMNPRALAFVVVERGEEVVFRVREYQEDARLRCVSIGLSFDMKHADASVDPCPKL